MPNQRLCSILAFTLLSLSCMGAGPEGTIRKLYQALEEEDFEAFSSLLAHRGSNELDESKLRLAFSTTVQAIRLQGGIENVSFDEIEVDGDHAYVTATVRYGDGSEETNRSELIKEDGSWKIAPDLSK